MVTFDMYRVRIWTKKKEWVVNEDVTMCYVQREWRAECVNE
jgi:hypothetical protein